MSYLPTSETYRPYIYQPAPSSSPSNRQVLQPAVAAYQGWVKLEQLRKDPNIVLYFSNILQKPATWNDWE